MQQGCQIEHDNQIKDDDKGMQIGGDSCKVGGVRTQAGLRVLTDENRRKYS
jgi:hypothetical protein